MTYTSLSPIAQGFLCLWTFLLLILLLYNFLCFLQIGNGKSRVRCILLNGLAFLLLWVQGVLRGREVAEGFPGRLPALILILLLFLLTVLGVMEQLRIVRWSETHPSNTSIKEALDQLPTGLCYALPDGLPFLVNERMYFIYDELFGAPLLNATEAWEKIMSLPGAAGSEGEGIREKAQGEESRERGTWAEKTREKARGEESRERGTQAEKTKEKTRGEESRERGTWAEKTREKAQGEEIREKAQGEQKVLRLKNGSVIRFQRRKITMPEGEVYELLAADLSQEYALTEELKEKERRARAMNARLKSLMGTIEYVTMSRELLQLKVALHDNVGQCLLLTRQYLLAPNEERGKDLLDKWLINMEHLVGEGPEHWQLPYYVIGLEAAKLGIQMEIAGELPKEEGLLPVVDQAISAHITNVLRHADGHVARIRVTDTPGGYEIVFTNDGDPPAGEVRESGGLANLRRRVTEAGGRMVIHSAPVFEMQVFLPKEGAGKRSQTSPEGKAAGHRRILL